MLRVLGKDSVENGFGMADSVGPFTERADPGSYAGKEFTFGHSVPVGSAGGDKSVQLR